MATNPKERTAADAVFAPFRVAWQLCMSIIVIWLVSVAIHIGWVRWYQLEPAAHMEALIGYYVDQSQGQNTYVETIADRAYWLVFEATAAQRLLAKPIAAATGQPEPNIGLATRRSVWAAFRPDLVVAGYATVLFGVKLGLISIATALFAILMFAAGVDGIAQRAIRRACGGHESASLYHRAKLFGWRLLPPFAAGLFFCTPVSFDPAWIFMPTAILSALLVRLQTTYYKKHL